MEETTFEVAIGLPQASDAIQLRGEPSLADVMRAVEADKSLPAVRKQHWLTSIRRIAKGIGRPPESVPARLTSLRHPVARLSAAQMGLEPKSLINHKSNLRAAINHYMDVHGGPVRGVALSLEWQSLMGQVTEVKPKRLLSGIARFCSSRVIAPRAMSNEVVDAYFSFREATSFLETGIGRRRELIRAWNRCAEEVPGWPAIILEVPALALASHGPAWDAFPTGLRADLDDYLGYLAKPHRSANGKRRRTCRPATLRTTRAQVIAFARKAVELGSPIETLDCLAALLAPDVAQRVFEAYWPESDPHPGAYVVGLAGRLVAMARCVANMPMAVIESLEDTRQTLEEHRIEGLTEKNLSVVRAVLAGDIWTRVKDLPAQMMQEAVRMLNRSPRKAAVHAARATQILILTRAPISLGNLMSIRIGINLIRPGGERAPYLLTFPHYDVKNRVKLDFPFSPETSVLIERFIQLFRPHLSPRHREDWLFPGEKGHRSAPQASADIAKLMHERIGLRVTAHQFRHAAATFILRHAPGNFEFARRVLGHRNVATTIRFYAGLEGFQANERFGELIEERLNLNGEGT